MINNTKLFFIVVFCGLFYYFSSSFALAQATNNTVKEQSNSPKLSLEISKLQENYLKSEPISIDLKLSNRTNQPIAWKGSLISSNTSFIVKNSSGVTTRFDQNQYISGSTYYFERTMKPLEADQESSILERDLSEKLFPNAGEYELQIEFSYRTNVKEAPHVKILSNPISINIQEPQGINQQAYQFLKENLDASNSFRLSTQESVQRRQQFVDRFGNSVYAKYIIFSLGVSYQTLGEYNKALRELCKISGDNFHYAKEVEKAVFRIDSILNPVAANLNSSIPIIIRHPCTGEVLNP